MREVDVIGVRVETPSNQPIVLLREIAGDRYLPIWIGAVEATAQRAVSVSRQSDHPFFGNHDIIAHSKVWFQDPVAVTM